MDERSSYPTTRATVTPDHFPPAVEEFLRRPLAANLAMVNPNGTPQLTVMWFKYEDGDFLFTTLTGRVKFRNFQQNPRAIVSILDPADMFRYVIASGPLSLDERNPVVFYRELGRHYLNDEGYAHWQRGATTEGRTVLRLAPTRRRIEGFPEE